MINYEIQGKIAVITGATRDEVDVTIPAVLENKPVAKIEQQAFEGLKGLKRVVIPSSVQVIGSYAFANCPNLTEVVFNEGLSSIEDWAFIACNLENVVFPKSLKDVGTNAFLGNECKEAVDKYIKDKDTHKVKGRSNGHCAVFPIELLEARQSIDSNIVASRARYIDEQFDKMDDGLMTNMDLDIPFLFDGDEFMVAVWHKKEMPNITFEVAGESKPLIGLYAEDDPDFLIIRINILANGNLVSTFPIKTPYLEGLEILNKECFNQNVDGINYCFIRATINEAAYGNGNLEREFSINMFNHLDGKFKTELKNKLITEMQYEEIRDAIDNCVINVTQGFLEQIDGAPKWTYLMNMMHKLEADDNLNHAALSQYVFKYTVQYYNELTDIHSLEHIVFDLDEHMEALKRYTGKDPLELNIIYDTFITDAQGINLNEEEAASYRAKFIDLETNYNLHGDFLNYIYKEMQKMQNKFAIMAFSA